MSIATTAAADPGRVAFDATANDRVAIDLRSAKPYGLDAIYASMTAAAILTRLEPYLEAMTALPGIDTTKLERFALYAEALYFTQTTLVSRASRAKQMPALASEGWKVREIFMKYADLLVTLERFPADVLARLREGSGYRDLIEDLGALTAWFREVPDLTAPGSLVTVDLVDRAAELARTMRDTAGLDHDLDLTQGQLLAERQKLGVLLLAAHSEIRRAIEYIRYHEGDAATLAPTLYAPTKGRRAPASHEEPVDDLAAIHHDLHAHDLHEQEAPLDPEDNPFAPDED